MTDGGKLYSTIFCKLYKMPFSMYLKFYEITFTRTLKEVKEFREISNKEITTVGDRLSFSDNFQKLKFRGPSCGSGALPW